MDQLPEHPLVDAALASGPPLEITDWSLDRNALEVVLAEVDAGAQTILECGSGISTILVGRLLRDRRRGSLHSLEHDPGWVTLGRSQLAAEGLDAYVRIIEAPLEPNPKAAQGCPWYARSSLAELPRGGVDLLLVDGPPAPAGSLERSRYPALPVLAPRLAANARVILDDVERAGEAWVLQRWQEELGLNGLQRRGALALGVLKAPAMNL